MAYVPTFTPESLTRADVDSAHGPMVLEFGTNWCGWCRGAQPDIQAAFAQAGAEVPHVPPEARFSDLMREMSAKGLGASAIVDAAGQVLGIFTDGDLRRRIEAGADLRSTTAAQVMHPNPRRIAPDALAVDAAEMMEAHAITSVLVVDAAGVLVGVVHIGDLMRAKVI